MKPTVTKSLQRKRLVKVKTDSVSHHHRTSTSSYMFSSRVAKFHQQWISCQSSSPLSPTIVLRSDGFRRQPQMMDDFCLALHTWPFSQTPFTVELIIDNGSTMHKLMKKWNQSCQEQHQRSGGLRIRKFVVKTPAILLAAAQYLVGDFASLLQHYCHGVEELDICSETLFLFCSEDETLEKRFVNAMLSIVSLTSIQIGFQTIGFFQILVKYLSQLVNKSKNQKSYFPSLQRLVLGSVNDRPFWESTSSRPSFQTSYAALWCEMGLALSQIPSLTEIHLRNDVLSYSTQLNQLPFLMPTLRSLSWGLEVNSNLQTKLCDWLVSWSCKLESLYVYESAVSQEVPSLPLNQIWWETHQNSGSFQLFSSILYQSFHSSRTLHLFHNWKQLHQTLQHCVSLRQLHIESSSFLIWLMDPDVRLLQIQEVRWFFPTNQYVYLSRHMVETLLIPCFENVTKLAINSMDWLESLPLNPKLSFFEFKINIIANECHHWMNNQKQDVNNSYRGARFLIASFDNFILLLTILIRRLPSLLGIHIVVDDPQHRWFVPTSLSHYVLEQACQDTKGQLVHWEWDHDHMDHKMKTLITRNACARCNWQKIAPLIAFIRASLHHPFQYSIFPLLSSITSLIGSDVNIT